MRTPSLPGWNTEPGGNYSKTIGRLTLLLTSRESDVAGVGIVWDYSITKEDGEQVAEGYQGRTSILAAVKDAEAAHGRIRARFE